MRLTLSRETRAYAVFPRDELPGSVNSAMIVSSLEEAEQLRALYEKTHQRPADLDEVDVLVSQRKA